MEYVFRGQGQGAVGSAERPAKAVESDPAEPAALIEPPSSAALHEKPLRLPTARAEASAGQRNECVSQAMSLWAELDGATVEVVVDAAPVEDGWIFVRTASGERSRSVDAASLRLLRIVARRLDH